MDWVFVPDSDRVGTTIKRRNDHDDFNFNIDDHHKHVYYNHDDCLWILDSSDRLRKSFDVRTDLEGFTAE